MVKRSAHGEEKCVVKRSACGKIKGVRARKKRVCKENGAGEDSTPSSIGLPKHGRCGGKKSLFSHHSGPSNRFSALCIHVLALLPRRKRVEQFYTSLLPSLVTRFPWVSLCILDKAALAFLGFLGSGNSSGAGLPLLQPRRMFNGGFCVWPAA